VTFDQAQERLQEEVQDDPSTKSGFYYTNTATSTLYVLVRGRGRVDLLLP
jgi:hypothetical protein